VDFEISASLTHPIAMLQVKGEVDLSNADNIGALVDHAIAAGCTLVAVDLYEVAFIDCSAIGALLAAKRRLDAASGHLWVHAFSPQVLRMLQLTATDAIFGLSDLVLVERPLAVEDG
jgi:anti-sigma B factor antagonist